ncbi:MAG TPA: penicillin-binding protein 2 [Candidatus Sulfomarinibacteraceae bacterium]|nr:penicillin-binding protein 2 [Candidatus Sulfomarinibacteraceae bacterium]
MSTDTAAPVARRSTDERSPIRFIAFGLVIVLAATVLLVRLFALQVASGGRYATLADTNRSTQQAIPATRGVIYDRNGVPLVSNVPAYSVKVRPADLPESRRADVVARLSALLGLQPADINVAIDSNPGSRFDLVRIAADVAPDVANFISESRLDLPGVEVVVESRREYATGPLLSQVIGYTGPINEQQLLEMKPSGYLPDDLIGLDGVEARYESTLRGTYGLETVERNAAGRRLQVLQVDAPPVAGNSLELTIDVQEQRWAEQALRWGMSEADLKRGVVIVMNPQTGEILALVSLPTYDDNLFARGIDNADYQALVSNPDKPLLNHAISAHYPPGSTYKLVTGAGGLADGKISPKMKLETQPYLTLGTTKFYEWNRRGWGDCDIMCGFAHSSDTFFFQVAGMLGIDRLAYWANQFGFGQRSGIDLPGEVAGTVPSTQWKLETLGTEIYPGELYHAGIGQGYDVVTPLQLVNAYAALANGGTLYRPRVVREVLDPDGNVVTSFEPEILRKLDIDGDVLETMRRAARNVVLVRHTYNLVDLPIVVAGKSGTAEFGTRDAEGRLPFHSWFVAFVPRESAVAAGDPTGLKAASGTDSELAVVAFAYDSRTLGNVATEIVKYYLQLHYGIERDYRNFDLLERGNFYQSN